MMFNELLLWQKKLKEGIQLSHDFYQSYGATLPKHIQKIAFVGMGGSGIAGRVVQIFLERRFGIVSSIIDSPFIPAHIDISTLVIVISYSGDTWEVRDALYELTQKFIPTVVIAHGGSIIQHAESKGIPFALLPSSLTPRSALGNFLGFLMGLLDSIGVLPGGLEIAHLWEREAGKYVPLFKESFYFKGFLEVACSYDVFHVWGVSHDSSAAAYRAATQFNENSKVLATYSSFPELAHNLLVGFNNITSACIVMFYSDFLPVHMHQAILAMNDILQEKGLVLYKVPILGDTFECQIFTMILWADFASYHLGTARNIDVEKVHVIDEFKKRQKSKGIT